MKQRQFSNESITSQSLGEETVGWKQLSLGLKLALFGLWWIVAFVLGYVLAGIV